METAVQLGLEPEFTRAWVKIGARWWQVPAWVACEMNGGIRRLIEEYGLRRYHAQREENRALDNIAKQARALRDFYLRHDADYYGDLLRSVERDALLAERDILQRLPHLKGWTLWEAVAAKMGRNVTARQARAVLAEATDLLAADLDGREMVYLENLASKIQKASEKEAEKMREDILQVA